MKGELKALGCVGYKNSGKTSLIVEVAKILTAQKYKVVMAKFSHHDFDREDTDTKKFKKCGCISIGLSENETFISWPFFKSLTDILPLLDADVLLVEGGKDLGWLPRIVLPKDEKDFDKLDNGLVLGYYHNSLKFKYKQFKNPAEVASLVLEKGFALPGLNCGACGFEDCSGLGKAIVQNKADISFCKILNNSETIVKVENKRILLNPFVERVLKNNILAVLTELKGFKKGKIEVKFTV
ncbi:molybdopterin-guanine dinucleotide biosynthesis protein MobB [Desulfonauticus submarinus]